MPIHQDENLLNALKELQFTPQDVLDDAYKQSTKTNTPFSELLLKKDLISSESLARLEAELNHVEFIDLTQVSIDKKVLFSLPEVFARNQKVVVFKIDTRGIHVAMANPNDLQVRHYLETKLEHPLIVYQASIPAINSSLAKYVQDVKADFNQIISQDINDAQGQSIPEPSIIKVVNDIVEYAYHNNASDIHLEPTKDSVVVRFRLDGLLNDVTVLPKKLHPQIVSRIQVLAKLPTDEHQSAQDGKIVHQVDDDDLDLRVSIVPTITGEKIVMRLLSERNRRYSLSDLGLSPADTKRVEESYKKPYGMILSTGPTGSGKTTTLYTILKNLNIRDVNIMTIEDPVEYDIQGVNQIQVNPQTNLTFAKGLKSIVRQDPDIILVGEVRDQTTASIATNAAMTGHLVLSSLHTNDAATAIPRLLDLEVEPFLIASTVNIIIAQRLVRRICNACRVSVQIDLKETKKQIPPHLHKKYLTNRTFRTYKGKGCPTCHHTGYSGRIGIFEIIQVDNQLRDAIVSKLDADKIKKISIKNGMTSMLEDGLLKTKEGITTLEEVLRVTKE